MLCGLIMAGGKGTRFWPASTEDKPKQFLKLTNNNKTMLQLTVDRLKIIIPYNRIFIVSNIKYKDLIQEQIPDLPENNIILEPLGRNTAPCILSSCFYIKKFYKDACVAVFPSDHYISDTLSFKTNVLEAYEYVRKNSASIITFGVRPTRPETGYGYIKSVFSEDKIQKVDCFVEKPDLDSAKKYFNDNAYLWNSGMFLFNIDYMVDEIKKYIPQLYDTLSVLEITSLNSFDEVIDGCYKECISISIDYGVMERSRSVYVINALFDWDDVGSWDALARYLQIDNANNKLKGNCISINSNDNIIYSTNKKIVLLNVQELFCIETEDIIVIGNSDEIEKLHQLKGKINEQS